jgi:hypothetical protein
MLKAARRFSTPTCVLLNANTKQTKTTKDRGERTTITTTIAPHKSGFYLPGRRICPRSPQNRTTKFRLGVGPSDVQGGIRWWEVMPHDARPICALLMFSSAGDDSGRRAEWRRASTRAKRNGIGLQGSQSRRHASKQMKQCLILLL